MLTAEICNTFEGLDWGDKWHQQGRKEERLLEIVLRCLLTATVLKKIASNTGRSLEMFKEKMLVQ